MAVGRRGARREPRLVLLLTMCVTSVCAFNVDIKHAVKVPAPSEDDRGYFGFSVALTPPKNGVSSLLVGAPRANSLSYSGDKLIGTGATFLCPITPTKRPCSRLEIEHDTYIDGQAIEVNDSFFGAALDVRPEGTLVVCNPNWKTQLQDKEGYSLKMLGACYHKDSEDDSISLILNKDAWGDKPELRLSQMGFSVNFVGNSEDSRSHILMGAPGAWAGMGTAALLTSEEGYPVLLKFAIKSLADYSYFGYSVGAGMFGLSKDHLYVSGAPRAASLKGMVYLYKTETQKDEGGKEKETIVIEREISGQQTGEYFGASLAVADLNGDGMDDLLVGAPLRSYEAGDEGAVYVFASNTKGELTKVGEEPAIMGKERGARFGTAIAVLGDINRDGYPDIAIGAPYEDGLRGAVYVYHGTPHQPYLKFAQKLRAQDIHESLEGFGYSISSGRDIDNNKYNDFAVGAYLNNSAIVLRTSPVVYINAHWGGEIKRINTSSESLNVSLCISFGGFNVRGPVQVEVRIALDPMYDRAYFAPSQVKKSYNTSLTDGRESCEHLSIVPKNFTKIFKPLEVSLEYKIIPTTSAIDFCANCPVLDPNNNTATLNLWYETGCDGDDCKIDIELQGDFVNASSPYVVGNGSKIEFFMNISNPLEPSYETNVFVNITSAISLAQIDRFCQKMDKKDWDVIALHCTVPKTLQKNVKGQEIRLLLDGNSAPWGVRELVVNAIAVGSGKEVSPEDNALTRTLPLQHEAEVYTFGRPQPPSISYTVKQNTGDGIIFQDKFFKHTYQVNNDGPSPVDDVIIRFMIPSIIQLGSDTFNLTHVDENRLPESIKCHKSLSDDPISSNFLVNASHLKSDFELPDTYLRVDCSLSNVQCLVLECSVSHPILARSGVSITLEMTALLKQLGPVVEEGAILLHTWGIAESAHINNENLPNNKSDACLTETLFLGQRPASRLQPWIIVIAILFGILLLAIVILVLWKIGFFKRKKLPEEEDMIETGNDQPTSEEEPDVVE